MSDKPWIHIVTLSAGRDRPEHSDYRFALAGDKRYNLIFGRGRRKPVCNNRNRIVAEFLLNPPDKAHFLLMMDNDVAPHGNALDYVEQDLDIVVFPCPIWMIEQDVNMPLIYNVSVAQEDGEKVGVSIKGNDLMEVSTGGTGAILIARRVLEHPDMAHPFREITNPQGLSVLGHDLAFCERARRAGFKVWASFSHKCSHWDEIDLSHVHAIYQRERHKAAGRYVPPRDALSNRRLVFSLSPGRCGTQYLTRMLATIPGIAAFHEPEPSFVHSLQRIQYDPGEAYRFWLETKIPAIMETEGTYIETSSLFGKGYAKALLDMGIVPDILVIRRPHREVALSMWRRDAIPGRSRSGNRFHINPGQRPFVPLPEWEKLTDYQICYWFALEMEKRAQVFAPMFQRQGARVVETTLAELTTQDGFFKILEGLKLRDPSAVYYDIWEQRFNETHEVLKPKMPEEDLDAQEGGVEELIGEENLWPGARRAI